MDVYSCSAPAMSQVRYVTDFFQMAVATCIFRVAANSMYHLHIFTCLDSYSNHRNSAVCSLFTFSFPSFLPCSCSNSEQTTPSRFSTMRSNLASSSATWNPTRGCPWCTSTTACAPRWRWWRRRPTRWPWGPTTSTPWASPRRSWPRSSRSRCPWRSRTTLTTYDRPSVSRVGFIGHLTSATISYCSNHEPRDFFSSYARQKLFLLSSLKVAYAHFTFKSTKTDLNVVQLENHWFYVVFFFFFKNWI